MNDNRRWLTNPCGDPASTPLSPGPGRTEASGGSRIGAIYPVFAHFRFSGPLAQNIPHVYPVALSAIWSKKSKQSLGSRYEIVALNMGRSLDE